MPDLIICKLQDPMRIGGAILVAIISNKERASDERVSRQYFSFRFSQLLKKTLSLRLKTVSYSNDLALFTEGTPVFLQVTG